jgi:putative flippase GtrA
MAVRLDKSLDRRARNRRVRNRRVLHRRVLHRRERAREVLNRCAMTRKALAVIGTPQGRKMFRYSAASAVSVVVSVVLLVIFDGVLRMSAVASSTLATAIATVPSYEMNRKWAWGRSGRGHVWREVVPFWALAFLGWAFSTYSVKLTEDALGRRHTPLDTAIIAAVYIGAFGVLWVAKFVIFNRVLFVDRAARVAASGGVEVRG